MGSPGVKPAAPVLMMGRTLPQIAVSSSFCRTEDEGGVGIDSSYLLGPGPTLAVS